MCREISSCLMLFGNKGVGAGGADIQEREVPSLVQRSACLT